MFPHLDAPGWLALLGGLFVLVAALWVAFRERRESVAMGRFARFAPATLAALGTAMTLLASAWSTSEQSYEAANLAAERHSFESAMRKKSDQIIKLQANLAEWTTGGEVDFYAIPDLTLSRSGGPVSLILGRWSERPLYDVKVRVRDLAAAIPFSKLSERLDRHVITRADFQKGEQTFDIGTVGLGSSREFGGWQPGKDGGVHLGIWISARNGTVSEALTIYRRSGKLAMALHAVRESSGEKVFDQVTDGFPRAADGKPAW
jgi:hypothetical protein